MKFAVINYFIHFDRMMHHLTSSLILLLESVSLNKIAAGMLKDRIFQMVDCIANPSSGLVARLHSSGEILAPEDLFPLESLLVRIIRYVELLVRDDAIAFFLDNDSQRRFEEYDKAIIITTDNMVQKFSDGVDYKMDRFFVDQLRPRQYFIACNLRYSPSSARLFALIDGPQPLRSEQGKLSDVGKAVKILTNEFENLNSEANAVTSLSLVGLIKQTAMKAFWLSNFGTTHTVNSKEFCSRLLLAVQESELQQEMKQRTKLPKPQSAILVGNPDVKSEISLSVAQQQQLQSLQRDIDSAKYLPQIIKKTFCHDAYDVLHVIEVAKAVRHIPEEETLHGAVKSIVSLGVKMCIRNIPPPVRVLSRVAWNGTEKAQMRLLLTYRGWVGVIGPRGSGKTTRLLDVVHSLPKDRDAVWVNLAGVTRCEDVRHRVASQLLLRDADSSRDFERKLRSLFESLREGSVVVFDNIPDQIVASSRGMVAGSIAATASVAAAAAASSSGVAVAGTAPTGSAAQPRIESMSSTAAQPSGLGGQSHHEPLEYSDYFAAISRISQDFHCKLCFVTLSTSEIKIHSYLEGPLAPTKLPSQVDLKDQTTLLKRPKNFFGKLMIVELLSHSAAVAWAEDIYPCSSEMLTRVGQSIGPNGDTDVAETNDIFPGMGAVIAAGDALTYAGGAIAAASSALVVTVTGAGPPVPQDKPSRALSLALAGGKYAGDMVSLTRFGYFEAIRRAQDRVNPRVLIERECLEDFSRDEMLCAGSLVGVNSIVDAGLAWALCKKTFQGDMVRWLIAWKGLVRRGWLTEELGLGYTVPKGFKPSYATALSSPTVARGLSIEEYYRNKSLIFPGFTIPMISAAELSELVTTLMPPLPALPTLPALPALPSLPSLPLLSSGLVENGILKDGEEEEMKEDSDDETVVDPESIVESSGRGHEAGEKGDAEGSGAVQSDPARVGGDDEDKDAATSPSVSPSHSPVEASDSKFPPPKLESPTEADYPTYKKHTSTPVAVTVSTPVPAPMRFNRSAYLMYWAEQAARINKEAAVTSTALLFYDANITHFRVLFERLCLEATSLSIHSGFHADKNLAGVGMILAGNLSRLLNYRVTAAHGVEITRAVLSVLANTDQGGFVPSQVRSFLIFFLISVPLYLRLRSLFL